MQSLKWKLFSWSELLQLRYCLRTLTTWAELLLVSCSNISPGSWTLIGGWVVSGQWSLHCPLSTSARHSVIGWDRNIANSHQHQSAHKCNLQFATLSTVSTLKWTVFLTYTFTVWQWCSLILKIFEGKHGKKKRIYALACKANFINIFILNWVIETLMQ